MNGRFSCMRSKWLKTLFPSCSITEGRVNGKSDSELSWKWLKIKPKNYEGCLSVYLRGGSSVNIKGGGPPEFLTLRDYIPLEKLFSPIHQHQFWSYFIRLLHMRIECITVAQPSDIKFWNSRPQLWRCSLKCSYIRWIWWFFFFSPLPWLGSWKLFGSQMNNAL